MNRYGNTTPPALVVALGLLTAAGFSVAFALIWQDGVAAVGYQWGLAGYREAPAHVVDSYTTRGRNSSRQVVLDANGTRQTLRVQDRDLFGQLKVGEAVRERIVNDRVVAIRVGGNELPIEDNLAWLVGLPGGILTGVLVLVMGIRAGLAKGFITRGGLASWQASTAGLPEGLMFVAAVALFFSGLSITLIEAVTSRIPPFQIVASVIAVFTVAGVMLSIRMVRMTRTLGEVGLRVTSGELITALIGTAKNGGWDVSFIGDGRVPKDLTLSTLDESAVSQIETLIADTHKKRPVDVSFTWYPWEESKGGRGSRGEFMIFLTQHEHGDYVATLDGRPEVTASSPTFEGLSNAIETVMASQGDTDRQHLQACITWNRTLTNFGYVHSVP